MTDIICPQCNSPDTINEGMVGRPIFDHGRFYVMYSYGCPDCGFKFALQDIYECVESNILSSYGTQRTRF